MGVCWKQEPLYRSENDLEGKEAMEEAGTLAEEKEETLVICRMSVAEKGGLLRY